MAARCWPPPAPPSSRRCCRRASTPPHLCFDLRLERSVGNCWLCVVELANEQRDAKACQTPVRAQRLDAVVDVRLVRLGERHPTEQVHVTMDGERSAPEQLESICRLSRN